MSGSSTGIPQQRVVILGGGCGGVAAALWLSSTPQLRQRFRIELYTRGWRLGGKGASGRNPAHGNRIEEHGLHIWLGFYTNAFRTMRQAFAALPPHTTGTFRSIEQAFQPENNVVFMQLDGPGTPAGFLPWSFDFPVTDGEPGASAGAHDPKTKDGPGLWAFRLLTKWLMRQVTALALAGLANIGPLLGVLTAVASNGLSQQTTNGTAGRIIDALDRLQDILDAAQEGDDQSPLSELPTELRRLALLCEFATVVLRGYLRDILPHLDRLGAYDALNAHEFRDWLRRHRASDRVLQCAPLQALYDLGFAYPDGDTSNTLRGSMAAGVTLRLAEELVFGYRQAPLWKMAAGMGDTIFTPIWDALHAQGVKVNLFHALEEMRPTTDGQAIGGLRLRRQARTKLQDNSRLPYDPFVVVQGLRCWPSEPDWTQLENGDALKAKDTNFERIGDETAIDDAAESHFDLTLGQDFDAVVLAIPPAALVPATPALRINPRWAGMLDRSISVATQAFQIWLKVPSTSLLFTVRPTNPPPVSAFAQPFATWADMSHLIQHETWPESSGHVPLSVHYFCGPMPTPAGAPTGSEGESSAKTNADMWMESIAALWPGAITKETLQSQFCSQFYRSNTDPSERYVLVTPGTVSHRLAPDSLPFSNLYLAGDWTLLPFSGGCVETAVWSGMIAAQALAQTVLPATKFPIDNH